MAYYALSVAGDHTGKTLYTYEFDGKITVGQIVLVPFGRQKHLAIVRNVVVNKPTFKTKRIIQVLDFVLPTNSLDIMTWMERFYPYDLGEISRLFVPANATVKSRPKTEPDKPRQIKEMPQKTKEQKRALKIINDHKNVMLYGVTGSGKTRVFLEAANSILAKGKSALFLTPEIGLTPQLVDTVQKYSNAPVLVMHSQKTPAQRKAIWEYVSSHKTPYIIIGPRSSLFLPYQNLGLVVADESHDQSYHNMSSPRYNGIYVAAKLAALNGASFVQSTATPNVADYLIYQQRDLPIARIKEVAAGGVQSSGHVVDLSNKELFTKSRHLSDALIDKINSSLLDKKQSLIFLNKRGSARIVQCADCGYIVECPNCGLPLTYHHDDFKLKCHLCNYTQQPYTQCPSCKSADLLFEVPGTKGLEQHIASLFPSAKIARFDLDNSSKDTLKNRYAEIADGSVDIILGTQLVSKGLDLPNLSVVGVLNADSSLQLPDYRSEETAFQQLYQVTGRVGRGHTPGSFVLQTRHPDHPIIQAALNRDYDQFIEYETNKRKSFAYPPYSYIAIIKISKAKDATAQQKAELLAAQLRRIKGLTILGPSPSFYHKFAGKYTWQIILKSPNRQKLVDILRPIDSDWAVSIDPPNLL